MLAKRDGFIDFSKGLLILWVIHIHTVFWSGMSYVTEPYRQLSLLIDVSAFFFISGYLTKPLDFVSSFRRAFKQFKDLYLNYLALSCLLLLPLSIIYFLKDKATPNLLLAIISTIRVEPTGELWGDLYVYPGSMWYLAVYLSLLIISAFILSFFGSRKFRIAFLISCLFLFTVASSLDWKHGFLFTEDVYIYFYLFIYVLGVTFKLDEQYISTHHLKLFFLTNLTICLLILFVVKDGTLQLHLNKFPPKLIYLPYSLLIIQVFLLVKRIWNYPAQSQHNSFLQFLEWCGKNSYFIYLLQGVVCSIPGFFIPILFKMGVPTIGVYVVSLAFNMTGTLLVTTCHISAKVTFLNFLRSFTPGRLPQ